MTIEHTHKQQESSPAAGQAAPVPQPVPDQFGHFVVEVLGKKPEEAKRDRDRVVALGTGEDELDLSGLHQAIGRTVMEWVAETTGDMSILGMELLKLRNWIAFAHDQHANHLDDHEQRIYLLEQLQMGGDSQLTAEDAQLFARVCEAAEDTWKASLEQTTDPKGKELLTQLIEMAGEAKARIDEIEMPEDEDEDDEDDSDEDENAS